MVRIAEVEPGCVDPVLNNLINRVDNIVDPEIDDLKELLNKNAKLMEIRSGSDIVAHFFTDIQGDVLVLECMLGKSINNVDPCIVLMDYANRYAIQNNLKRIQINTKRPGVVRKFIGLGFDTVQFTLEKEVY